MADLVVTVPRDLWVNWIDEGDAVGEPETGEEWGFFLGGWRPPIKPGERLYVVAHDRLRGFAPVTRVAFAPEPCPDHLLTNRTCERCRIASPLVGEQEVQDYAAYDVRPRLKNGTLAPGRWAICREGGAQAVTIGPTYSRPARPEHDDLAYIRGFQGFVQRWWPREAEVPFPDWRDRDLWLNKAAAQRKRELDKAERAQRRADAKARQGSMFDG